MTEEKKCIPKAELPFEKFQNLGPSYLTDSELLAIILRSASAKQSVFDLSKQLLSMKTGGKEGFLGLMEVSLQDLQKLPGIGKVKAIQIKALLEISVRISAETAKEGISIQHPSTVADYFMEKLRHLENEVVFLACLNGKGCMICEKRISEGSMNRSTLSPRSVFMEALRVKAASVILVHNHPSGDPTPSRQDVDITARMRELGELMEIPVLDHIIIGDRCYYSFLEQREAGY